MAMSIYTQTEPVLRKVIQVWAGKDFLLGIVGGVCGGAVGWFVFSLIARQGYHALALPGALVGLGCGALSGRRSLCLGFACACAALALGAVVAWRVAPFADNSGLEYYLLHLDELPGKIILLILTGVAIAFWFGCGREGGAWLRKQPPIRRS